MWIEMADSKGKRWMVEANDNGAVKIIGKSVRPGYTGAFPGGAHVVARRWVATRQRFAKAQVCIPLNGLRKV